MPIYDVTYFPETDIARARKIPIPSHFEQQNPYYDGIEQCWFATCFAHSKEQAENNTRKKINDILKSIDMPYPTIIPKKIRRIKILHASL